MEPRIVYRVGGYAANPSAHRTCYPASRSHASGRVFQVHDPAEVLSVHVSRKVQRNPVDGVGQNSGIEPALEVDREASLLAQIIEQMFCVFHNIMAGIHSLSTERNAFALVGYSHRDTVDKTS